MKKFAFSLKAVAVAMGMMGIAQCAGAAILTNMPSTGNGSFLFVAADETHSWIQGINFTLDDSFGTDQQTFNLTGLQAFFAGSTSAYWGVIAGDATNLGESFNGYRMAFSLATDTTQDIILSNPGHNQFAVRNSAETLQTWLNRSDDGNRTPGAKLTSTDQNDIFNLYNDDAIGLDISSQGQFYATGLADGSELTNWVFDNGPDALELYDDSFYSMQSNWRLNLSSNQLVYAPAAAPVPVPAALWLLGSALVGVTGIRRRA
jgi:hypothetical protein